MVISKEAFLIHQAPCTDELKKKILPYRKQEELLDKWLVKKGDKVIFQNDNCTFCLVKSMSAT